ncbi:MAG: transcription antitermination protein NusB [bacterium]
MKKYTDPRHSARILAVEQIYQNMYPDLIHISMDDMSEMSDITRYDEALFEKLTTNFKEYETTISETIGKIAIERPLDQISKTSLIIMQMAILEHNILKITPRKVVIDESIELAKEFGSDSDASFVNGVLDKALENKVSSIVEVKKDITDKTNE